MSNTTWILLTVLAICYTGIGYVVYTTAVQTPMLRRDQILYSVAWPWLIIATVCCAIWDFIAPMD